MKNNYTLKVPLLDQFSGDNYESISFMARYAYFSWRLVWTKSATLSDNVTPMKAWLWLYHYNYTAGQTSNLPYVLEMVKSIDVHGRSPVESYTSVSDFTGLTFLSGVNSGTLDSTVGLKKLDFSTALDAYNNDTSDPDREDLVIYMRMKDASGTSTPNTVVPTGGTILLGDLGKSNLYGFYDRSSSSFPNYLEYLLGTTDDTFNDGPSSYTGMTGPNNHSVYPNSYATDEIQQLDSSGKVKRIFWKFNIPAKLYGKIDFTSLNINITAEDNTSRICSYKIYGTSNVSWSSASTNAQMNTLFSSAIYLGERKGLGCMRGIGVQQTDVGGHPYLSEWDATYAAIPGSATYQIQGFTQFTLIIDDVENTRSTASVATVALPLFGRNDLTQSARKTIVGKNQNSVLSPYVSHYYVPPVIHSDKTSFSKSVVAGSNVPSDSFNITNNGRGQLYPVISDNMSWLSVSGGVGPIVRNGSNNQDPMFPTDPVNSSATITFTTNTLSVGSYSGIITLTDPNANPTSINIPVSLTVTTGSSVGVDTTSIVKTVPAATNASNSTFNVFDNHDFTGDSINYTISESISWLSVSPTSGTSKSTTDQKTHTITYNTNILPLGDYTGNITVSDASSGTSKIVKVVTHVVSGSYIADSTNSITQTIVAGENASPVNIQIWDGNFTSLDSINVNITKTQSWLSVSPSSIVSFGIYDAKTLSVTFNTSELSLGVHTDTITINDPTLNLTSTISVSITVVSGSNITTDVSSYNLSIQTGSNLSNRTFNAWDLNSSLVDYIIYDTTTNVAWMNVTPFHDSSSNSSSNKVLHTITFDTSSLVPGDYTGLITLNATNISSVKTIDVFLTVTSGPFIVTDKDSLSYSINYSDSLADDIINVWDGNDSIGNGINYNIFSNVDWITDISPSSGISNSSFQINEHTISFNVGALLPGSYNGTISIDDPINELSKEIPILLIITSNKIKGSATYDYFIL